MGPIDAAMADWSQLPKDSSMADWSQLPNNMLYEISERIESPLYLLRLRSVCKKWRSALSPIPNHPPLPCNIPYPTTSKASTFSLYKRTLFLIRPPQQQQQQTHFCQPWLIKIGHDPRGRTQIWHALSRSQYNINTKVLDFYQLPVSDLGHEYFLRSNMDSNSLYSQKVVCARLGSGFDLLTTLTSGNLALFRSGDNHWTISPYMPTGRYDDVCVFKGRLCAVDNTCRTVVVGSDLSVGLVAEPMFRYGDKKHVVECEGELLLVVRYNYGIWWSRAKWFHVFRLQEEKKKWVELRDLGNWVLFVGNDSAFSVSMSDLCAKGNCLIFQDDTFLSGTGVFHLDNGLMSDLAHDPDYCKLFGPPQD